jgi:hypothetical protein
MQLVMQFCDLRSLLQLARCSSTTLASASDPVAWRGLSPLLLRSNVAPSPPLIGERIAASRLLRHCDIALRWESEEDESELFTDELRDVTVIPRLHSFLMSPDYSWAPERWQLLATAANFPKHLRVLRTSDVTLQECDDALLLQKAPLLQTLQLAVYRYDPKAMPVGYEPPLLAALPLLPHLTDLRVLVRSHAHMAPSLWCARYVGQCAGLRVLELHNASHAFVCAVLNTGGLRSLQHLRLIDIDAIAAPETVAVAAAAVPNGNSSASCNDWLTAMRTLAAAGTLRTLTLHRVDGINLLLEHVSLLLSSLQLVRVDRPSTPFTSLPSNAHSAPSGPLLRTLLTALPNTQFVLNQPSGGGHFRTDWMMLCHQWVELSKAHPHQLTVLKAEDKWAGDNASDGVPFW